MAEPGDHRSSAGRGHDASINPADVTCGWPQGGRMLLLAVARKCSSIIECGGQVCNNSGFRAQPDATLCYLNYG